MEGGGSKEREVITVMGGAQVVTVVSAHNAVKQLQAPSARGQDKAGERKE